MSGHPIDRLNESRAWCSRTRRPLGPNCARPGASCLPPRAELHWTSLTCNCWRPSKKQLLRFLLCLAFLGCDSFVLEALGELFRALLLVIQTARFGLLGFHLCGWVERLCAFPLPLQALRLLGLEAGCLLPLLPLRLVEEVL